MPEPIARMGAGKTLDGPVDPLEMIAANSRTSSEMIRRFYGSHVKSVLYMGSAFVDAEEKIRNTRYDKVNALAKEIGVEFDAYADDD